MHRTGSATLLAASLLAVPVSGQDSDSEPPFLSVTGDAEIQADPDQAVVRLGIEAEAEEAAAAQDRANRIAAAMLEAWRELGIPEDAVQTATLRLVPVYEQRPRGSVAQRAPLVVAYRASNELSVRLGELDRVGPTVDAAVAAGANRVTGIDFTLRDDLAVRQQALAQAVREARAKAATMAETLGVRLGPVLEIGERGVSIQPVRFGATQMMRMEAAPAAPTPVASGQVTVNASVHIRYRLEG